MSAPRSTVVTLPVVRIERGQRFVATISVPLDRLTYSRLLRRAEEWNIPPGETAAAVISESLRPKGRRQ